jgi:hypothetical protein
VKRGELEHLIRAAASIADDDELIIVGSQAILGQYPLAPAALCVSNEADVYPKHHPERADLIDGSIGEGSVFHDTFGYYAQCGTHHGGAASRVGRAARSHLRPCDTGRDWEAHDLVLSKLVAGREKDLRFAHVAASEQLVRVGELLSRVPTMPLDSAMRVVVEARVRALGRGSGTGWT